MSENEYPYPLPVVEETRYGGRRGAAFQNTYESDNSRVTFYDLEKHNRWNEDRTEENARDLPYEITRDDCRLDFSMNEEETRAAAAQLNAIIAEWDAK